MDQHTETFTVKVISSYSLLDLKLNSYTELIAGLIKPTADTRVDLRTRYRKCKSMHSPT